MRKITKKAIALLLVAILLASNAAIVMSQTMEALPIRATFESQGGEVEWDGNYGRITANIVGVSIVFYVGSSQAYVNENAVTLQSAVFIENDRAFVCQVDLMYVSQLLAEVIATPAEPLAEVITTPTEPLAEAVERDGFTDYPIVVGAGTDFALDGILSMPTNAYEPVPAVVIVHGSGPGDMHGSIFDNKPYRDIADYLAANGIAVIRYNKRTHAHAASLPQGFTVWEEAIEDAILAAELLRADPRVDPERVYILGHSLGGMLAPRIHYMGGNFAGLILFAGSPRFLPEISLTQNLMMLQATAALMEDDEREALLALLDSAQDLLQEQIAALLAIPDDMAKTLNLPDWGSSAYYMIDMYRNPAVAFLEAIDIPMLVMQGSNDLQVLVDIDFAMYKDLLSDRENVTFMLYEGLNHLFMPSSKTSILEMMDEYAIPAVVDAQVLTDIVVWVLGL